MGEAERTTTAWRAALLGACALAVCVGIVATIGLFHFPDFGASFARSGDPAIVHVARVQPGGAAAAAGLRAGDRLDLREQTFDARAYLDGTAVSYAGAPMTFVYHPAAQPQHTRSVTLRSNAYALTPDVVVAELGVWWLVAFAALMAWRRPDSLPARLLTVVLLCMVGMSWIGSSFLTPWTSVTVAAWMVGGLCGYAWIASFARFCAIAGRPSRLRRWIEWSVYVVGAVSVAMSIASFATVLTGAFDSRFDALDVSYIVLMLLLGASAATAIAQSAGAQRQMVAWACASFAPLLVCFLAQSVGRVAGAPAGVGSVIGIASNLLFFVVPIGLSYAALSRKLIDIGFVLNRAAVFAAVSLVVVGLFAVLEWVLGEWFSSIGRTAGLAINLAFALAVGFSMRFIHQRVENAIDRAFFRRRHENEAALRRLAHETAYISDADVLLDRVVAAVEEHAGASAVSLLVRDGDGRYVVVRGDARGSVSENDPAVVALRAWHEPVPVEKYDTALRGELAFPMAARGELAGVLVCAAKSDGEAYAPDETDALLALAHGAASALVALHARGDRAELEALVKRGFADLERRLDSLAARIDGERVPTAP